MPIWRKSAEQRRAKADVRAARVAREAAAEAEKTRAATEAEQLKRKKTTASVDEYIGLNNFNHELSREERVMILVP